MTEKEAKLEQAIRQVDLPQDFRTAD